MGRWFGHMIAWLEQHFDAFFKNVEKGYEEARDKKNGKSR